MGQVSAVLREHAPVCFDVLDRHGGQPFVLGFPRPNHPLIRFRYLCLAAFQCFPLCVFPSYLGPSRLTYCFVHFRDYLVKVLDTFL